MLLQAMAGGLPFGQPMHAQPWDSPGSGSGLQPTWGSGHSSLTTQQGFGPVGSPLSRYDSLPELSSLQSLSSLPRALPADLQMAPAVRARLLPPSSLLTELLQATSGQPSAHHMFLCSTIATSLLACQ